MQSRSPHSRRKRFPSPRASSGAGQERVYIVKPHDTLWSIAARTYGGDPRAGIWKLEQRNHLASATIRPGQRLVLPGG